MTDYRWLIYAILSAVAASFVGIFGRLGMKDMDSSFATAIRSVAMTLFLLMAVSILRKWDQARQLHTWAVISVTLSGIAGAVSWLFYFKAIQLKGVAKVAPIDKLSMPFAVILAVVLLQERFAWFNWMGVALIVGGAYLAAMSAK